MPAGRVLFFLHIHKENFKKKKKKNTTGSILVKIGSDICLVTLY